MIGNTKRSDGHFLKLFQILRNDEQFEIGNTEQVKSQLPETFSDIVRQIRESTKIEEKLREDKVRVCPKIREELKRR